MQTDSATTNTDTASTDLEDTSPRDEAVVAAERYATSGAAGTDDESASFSGDQARNLWIRSSFVLAIAAIGFPFLFKAASALWTHVLHHKPLANAHETSDKGVWLAVLLCCAVLMLANRNPRLGRRLARTAPRTFVSLGVLSASVLGIVWVQNYMNLKSQIWMGFGLPVLLTALVVTPLVWRAYFYASPVLITVIGLLGNVVIGIVYLPAMLQPAWGLMSPYDSGYIINETLAPIVGNYPMSGEVSQYTNLLGYPLLALSAVIPKGILFSNPGLTVSIYVTILVVLTFAILIRVAYRILPTHIRFLAPLFIVPLIMIHQQPADTALGSITAVFSAIPVRTGPIAILGWLLMSSRLQRPLIRASTIGLVAGLAALNNFEFGVPALIAALIACVLTTPGIQLAARGAVVFIAAAIVDFAAYLGAIKLVGDTPHLSDWTAYVRTFGNGFGNVPMPLLGTHVLVLMILGSGAILGFTVVRSELLVNRIFSPGESRRQRAAVTALFFGLAGLGSFGYYVGRSVTSTQLQIFLIPAAPVIAAMFGLITIPPMKADLNIRSVASVLAVLLPVGLVFGSLISPPDATTEWQRVLGTGVTSYFDSPYEQEAASARHLIAATHSKLGNVPLSLAITHGNYLSLKLHVPNVSVLNTPAEAPGMGYVMDTLLCKGISRARGPIIIGTYFYAGNPPGMCPGYKELLDLGNDYVVIARR